MNLIINGKPNSEYQSIASAVHGECDRLRGGPPSDFRKRLYPVAIPGTDKWAIYQSIGRGRGGADSHYSTIEVRAPIGREKDLFEAE